MKLEVSKDGRELIIRIPIRTVFSQARKKGTQLNYGLTARERMVLKELLIGKAHKEIAAKLNIAERTSKYHSSEIYRKTGLGRSQLIRMFGTIH